MALAVVDELSNIGTNQLEGAMDDIHHVLRMLESDELDSFDLRDYADDLDAIARRLMSVGDDCRHAAYEAEEREASEQEEEEGE